MNEIVQINQTVEVIIDKQHTEKIVVDGKTMLSQLLLGWNVGESRTVDLGIGVPRTVQVVKILS